MENIELIIFIIIIFFFFLINLIWHLTTISSYNNASSISTKILNYSRKLITQYNLSMPRESFDSNPLYIAAKKKFDPQDYSNEGFLLRDFYIAGSANSLVFNHIYNNFCSLTAIETILKLGARSIELNIFNTSYNKQKNGIPVCASHNTQFAHYKNDIGTFNYISLNNVCQTIIANAFLNSITDPLFLILNLQFTSNPNLCNQISNILFQNFRANLLDSNYSYQKQHLGDIPINNLKSKIVIICSKGFKNTDLDELVNGSWEERGSSPDSQNGVLVTKQYFTEINSQQGLGAQEIIAGNKKKMSILTPDINKINSRVVSYKSNLGFSLGFSIIEVFYFTLLDINGNQFFQQFEKGSFKQYSLILKPEQLRGKQQYITYDTDVPSDWNTALRPVVISDSSFLGGIKGV